MENKDRNNNESMGLAEISKIQDYMKILMLLTIVSIIIISLIIAFLFLGNLSDMPLKEVREVRTQLIFVDIVLAIIFLLTSLYCKLLKSKQHMTGIIMRAKERKYDEF